ncbi:MAG: hypothetical protein QM662_16170 [Gordonia sp. (in: high G+C Gram-positive bacteria)]
MGDFDSGEARSESSARTSSARSRSGGLAVVTTEQGLPLAVRIDDRELGKAPGMLAEEIVQLCRQSAMAAGIRLRANLGDNGTPGEVIDALGLPTTDDLVRAEHLADDGDQPTTWLRTMSRGVR